MKFSDFKKDRKILKLNLHNSFTFIKTEIHKLQCNGKNNLISKIILDHFKAIAYRFIKVHLYLIALSGSVGRDFEKSKENVKVTFKSIDFKHIVGQ